MTRCDLAYATARMLLGSIAASGSALMWTSTAAFASLMTVRAYSPGSIPSSACSVYNAFNRQQQKPG